MLDRTYEILKTEYGNKRGSDGKPQPFVFVGHSQGGLRALAMSTYLRKKDPVLYKQLKGVITLSGIDRGLKLLEGNGAVFRAKLSDSVRILSNGVYGAVKVVDFKPGASIVSDLILGEFIKMGMSASFYWLGEVILCNLSYTKGFAPPILQNRNWALYAQVRDMVPQSDFIKDYVLKESTILLQHKSKTEQYLTIEWKKGLFGIKYPCLVYKSRPIVIATKNIDMKIDKNLPLTFLAGTNSDTTSLMDSGTAKGFDTGFDVAGTIFRIAEYFHYAKCVFIIGLLTNSVVYSQDCRLAANWCSNYKSEIGSLTGSKTHDGLVALESQYLPNKSK